MKNLAALSAVPVLAARRSPGSTTAGAATAPRPGSQMLQLRPAGSAAATAAVALGAPAKKGAPR
jgi:hypothetical protein